MSALKNLAKEAKDASKKLALLSTEEKNRALRAMAKTLLVPRIVNAILKENRKDLRKARSNGLSAPLLARLELSKEKLKKIAASIKMIANLPDPVGRDLWKEPRRRPNGLKIRRVSVPIGVILIIYESRPNVTADCMALCLKSGNAVILKGGSEAWGTNKAMIDAMDRAAEKVGIPKQAFRFVKTGGRSAVKKLISMEMKDYIDLVIPRGGEGLIRRVARLSKIPVIKHYKGVCHVYVDKDADLLKAEKIVLNAKTQNPAVCNAMESLLVHRDIAKKFLPHLAKSLNKKKVKVHGDVVVRSLVPGAKKATEESWSTEYLDLILSARVVKNVGQAIEHIEKYGSHHSDAIVTENKATAKRFTNGVDSSAVFVNASTRFNDGGEFGMGAEMGISTDKLHARGPMGLEELTSYKYVVIGDGQVRG